MQTNNQESRRIILRDESRRNWLKRADDGLNKSPQSYRHHAATQWVRVLGIPRSPSHFLLVSCGVISIAQSVLISLKLSEPHWLSIREPLGVALTLAILITAGASWWIAKTDKTLMAAVVYFWSLFSVGIALAGVMVL